MDKELIDLGIRLGELAFVNTPSFITTKIKTFKNEKDIQKLKTIMKKLLINCWMKNKKPLELLKHTEKK